MNDGKIRRRVLIVEDESLVAMLLEEMLADLGHEVVATVSRSEPAGRLIDEGAVDFAILDVNLDVEHSYGLAEQLQTRGIPFVFATGYGSAGLIPQWRGAPTLQKPFHTRDLERAMRAALAEDR